MSAGKAEGLAALAASHERSWRSCEDAGWEAEIGGLLRRLADAHGGDHGAIAAALTAGDVGIILRTCVLVLVEFQYRSIMKDYAQ